MAAGAEPRAGEKDKEGDLGSRWGNWLPTKMGTEQTMAGAEGACWGSPHRSQGLFEHDLCICLLRLLCKMRKKPHPFHKLIHMPQQHCSLSFGNLEEVPSVLHRWLRGGFPILDPVQPPPPTSKRWGRAAGMVHTSLLCSPDIPKAEDSHVLW